MTRSSLKANTVINFQPSGAPATRNVVRPCCNAVKRQSSGAAGARQTKRGSAAAALQIKVVELYYARRGKKILIH